MEYSLADASGYQWASADKYGIAHASGYEGGKYCLAYASGYEQCFKCVNQIQDGYSPIFLPGQPENWDSPLKQP